MKTKQNKRVETHIHTYKQQQLLRQKRHSNVLKRLHWVLKNNIVQIQGQLISISCCCFNQPTNPT